MQTPLLIAVLTGLGGMIGWGFADLFAKKTIDEIGDITTLVVAHFFGTAFVILVALYEVFGKHHALVFPTTATAWLGLAFFGALQGVVYLLVYIGFGKGQVAVLNPIFSSFSGFVALISILFLGEQVRGIVAIGLLVIFGGIMLMNVDWTALRERKMRFLGVPGFPEVAIATVLAAVWTLGWNSFVGGIDWLAYAVAMYVCMTAALLIFALVRGVSLRVPTRWAWKYLVLIGIFESSAYILISWGYSVTTFTSVVAVLSGAFSLPTIIGARVWLKEHTVPAQLWGSLLIVVGVILIALV
jgi:drug/metabolite transporter (DMT)-like permease